MRKLKLTELNRLSTAEFKDAQKLPVAVVLDNVRSAMNIGSVFRTCDAFLLEALYLVGISAQPPNREILKTALGATETVDWHYFENPADCIRQIRANEAEIICIEQSDSSVMLQDYRPDASKKTVLVFGNEVHGVSSPFIEACDGCVEVPQWGMKHSLNISVCAGIVLWEVVSKLRGLTRVHASLPATE